MHKPPIISTWRTPRIYSASKIWHAEKWLTLRAKGFNIIASWIDIPCGTPEDKASAKVLTDVEKRTLWLKVMREVKSCDLLIIYSEPGEMQNGGLVEMAHAMALNKCVYTIGLAANMQVTPNSDCAFMQYPGIYDATIESASLEVQYRNAIDHYLYAEKMVA